MHRATVVVLGLALGAFLATPSTAEAGPLKWRAKKGPAPTTNTTTLRWGSALHFWDYHSRRNPEMFAAVCGLAVGLSAYAVLVIVMGWFKHRSSKEDELYGSVRLHHWYRGSGNTSGSWQSDW